MLDRFPILSYNLRSSPTLLASIFIVIIPLIDILFDFCQIIWNWFNEEVPSKKEDTHTVIYRLTDKERFVFITGMILQSAVIFVPSSRFDGPTMGLIYFCTKGAAQILLITPILFYLQRCTTTFTSLITTSILTSIVVGLMLFAIRIINRCDGVTNKRVEDVEKMLLGFGIFCFVLTAIVCLILYCIEKYNARFTKKTDGKHNESTDYIYTHYIPALHMIAYIILSFTGFASVVGPSSLEVYNYLSLLGQIMVLVIELRIRKNEVARELVSYVYVYICVCVYVLKFTFFFITTPRPVNSC
jgi:heme/copper-type cytochrome/quinol oxidase subunit 2